jgi:cyclase
MLTTRIIPCLDVDAGRVVKGIRFAGLRDAGDPAERAALYEEQGADELCVLDVSATPEGRGNATETVAAVREVLSLPLTVGGGVRCEDDAHRLLDAGADKVALNTAAAADPSLLDRLAARFGRQCTILSLDAKRRGDHWELVVLSGQEQTGRDAIEWAREAADRGAGEILLTSFDRDGTGDGYDTELQAAVSDAVNIPIVASGGASSAEHMIEVVQAGADAVLVASILHDNIYTVGQLKDAMARADIEVRR